jgi:hypothetical protein
LPSTVRWSVTLHRWLPPKVMLIAYHAAPEALVGRFAPGDSRFHAIGKLLGARSFKIRPFLS